MVTSDFGLPSKLGRIWKMTDTRVHVRVRTNLEFFKASGLMSILSQTEIY